MLKAIDVAKYFLNKDDGTLFNNKLVERSGRRFYEGNARLNKYLHIAQNQYSNYSVSQIAEACGYPEPLYFTRVFTAYYGKPPSEFMKFRRSGEKGANV